MYVEGRVCMRDGDQNFDDLYNGGHLQRQIFDRALQHRSAHLLFVSPNPVSQMALSCF
jgi:hypothetical protein